ncbi:hypothetical protein Ancab_031549, partial [Ancistrocladus abbreviatus]
MLPNRHYVLEQVRHIQRAANLIAKGNNSRVRKEDFHLMAHGCGLSSDGTSQGERGNGAGGLIEREDGSW